MEKKQLSEKEPREKKGENFHSMQILQSVRSMYRKRSSASYRTENPV